MCIYSQGVLDTNYEYQTYSKHIETGVEVLQAINNEQDRYSAIDTCNSISSMSSLVRCPFPTGSIRRTCQHRQLQCCGNSNKVKILHSSCRE